ncbi:MAG: hypothetical protein IJG94_11265 [Clostridia bacterium]|nr:hypothetical protein [Clostridia bacterium]
MENEQKTSHEAKRLRSPDDLERYVKITNPSVLLVLGACAALLIGVLVWGFFGSVSVRVQTVGVYRDGQTFSFLSTEDFSKVHTGDSAMVDGIEMKVSEVAGIPNSREEAKEMTGSDYLTDTLMPQNWGYRCSFESVSGKTPPETVPLNIQITTNAVRPISLLFK